MNVWVQNNNVIRDVNFGNKWSKRLVNFSLGFGKGMPFTGLVGELVMFGYVDNEWVSAISAYMFHRLGPLEYSRG